MPGTVKKSGNLSDTRGPRAGMLFFRVFMRIFGVRHACRFVRFVAFFYAVFDREAFRAAAPYLRSRFPGAGGAALRLHFFRLIVHQGWAMVIAAWIRSGRPLPFYERNPDRAGALLGNSDRGLILLVSHVGCWQAAMRCLERYRRPVTLLIQANRNAEVAAMFSGAYFRTVANDSPFGGLLECVGALERGEIVCIMGDRPAGNGETAVALRVNGRELRVPASPWLLAARCGCPVVPIFPMMRGAGDGIDFYFDEPIEPDAGLRRRGGAAAFDPWVRRYAASLERMTARHPYQIFQYEPIVSPGGGDSQQQGV